MFPTLLLAVVVASTTATPAVYNPVFYNHAAPYVQPAAVRYVAPIEVKEPPKPYSFGYDAPAIGGGSSRQESSDGNGRVVGSYSLSDADGRQRVVHYYADETGFHANVQTNEPGTANESPADVSVQSYAAPAVAPKVIAAPAPYVAPVRYISPAPYYNVAAPLQRRVVAPVSYRIVSPYNNLAYSPATYGNYYDSISPYKLGYYK